MNLLRVFVDRTWLVASVFGVLCVSSPAAAVNYTVFVNDTGAPVTDFHYKETAITAIPSIPASNPWGAGTSTPLGGNEFQISYSGSPIAPNGKLTFALGSLTDDATHQYEGFVWTPGGQSTLPTIGTPEPSAWVLMLVGLGGIGLGLRSRRQRAAVAA